MRTREQIIHLRIVHVVIMIATAFFVYQFSNWSDALWIPISVLAIIGPFSPGLSIGKAKQRTIGSIAGLLLSVIIWFVLQYNPNLLVFIAVILVYFIGFTVVKEYTYFIMLVTIMLCVNFDYMNLFFNNEIVFLTNRSICVLTGVIICQFYEYFIFRHSYDNATCFIDESRLNNLIVDSWNEFNLLANRSTPVSSAELDLCINGIVVELSKLDKLKATFTGSYGDQEKTIHLIEHYEEKLQSIYYWMSSQAYDIMQAKTSTPLLNDDEINLFDEEELNN